MEDKALVACRLLKCDDLNCFYLSLDDASSKSDEQNLSGLRECLLERPLEYDSLSRDHMIAVRYDRQWYRATIIRFSTPQQTICRVHCFLVDIAVTAVLDLNSCYRLPSGLKSIRYRAIPCSIASVVPIGYSFDNATLKFNYGPVTYWSDVVRRNVIERLRRPFRARFHNENISYKYTNFVDIVFVDDDRDLGQILCDERFATRGTIDKERCLFDDDSDIGGGLTDEEDDEAVVACQQFVLTENCGVCPVTVDSIPNICSSFVRARLHLYKADSVLLHCWAAIESPCDTCFIFDNQSNAEISFSEGFGRIRAPMVLFPAVCERSQSNSVIVLPSGEFVHEVVGQLGSICLANNSQSLVQCLALDSVLDLVGTDCKNSVTGSGGKAGLVLRGFSCLVTTADVLLAILKQLKIECEFVYFVEADRYAASTWDCIKEYMDVMNEALVSYKFAITKRPHFLFHMNSWSKSCSEMINSLPSRLIHVSPPLSFGWMFFDALSVCLRSEQTLVSYHDCRERDDNLVLLLACSLGDKTSRTIVVCADDTSEGHVSSLIELNLGGLPHVDILNVSGFRRAPRNPRVRVIVFYDHIKEPFLSEIISLCGLSEVRHVHFFEPDLTKSRSPTPVQCPRLTCFGYCHRVDCDHTSYTSNQHLLFPSHTDALCQPVQKCLKTLEQLALLLTTSPKDRIISIRVRNVVSPSIFYGCLLSHQSSGTVFDCSEALTNMDFVLSSNASSLKPVSLRDLDSKCLYIWKDHCCVYRRVRVEDFDHQAIKVFLVDVGAVETICPDKIELYALSDQFADIPQNVIEFINCNIRPIGSDDYWPVLTKRVADKLLRGKLIQAEVVLMSSSRVWLDKANESLDFASLDVSLADETIKCKLVASGLACENPTHVFHLKNLFNIKSPDEIPPSPCTWSNRKSIQLGTVTVVDGCLVRPCNLNAERRLVFVHLQSMLPQLSKLNADIKNMAVVSQACDIHTLSFDDLCLVKVLDVSARPCADQEWYRARVHLDKALTLIDYGFVLNESERGVELKEYNVHMLQTAAMCVHIATPCYDFIDSEMFMDESRNNDFMVMDAFPRQYRLLSTRVDTEPVDISLCLGSVWPNELLLGSMCDDNWDRQVGNFRSLLVLPVCMYDKSRWAAARDLWSDLQDKSAVISFVCFAIVLSWKLDRELSTFLIENVFYALIDGVNGVGYSCYLLVSHCIRSAILEESPSYKIRLAQCLTDMLKKSDVLELDERPERLVSLFRMALSLEHCDLSLAKSILDLIPGDGMASLDQLDAMRKYLKESGGSPADPMFRQCICKLESSLVDAEDEPKLSVSPRRHDLMEDMTSVSGRESECSSDDERSSDDIEDKFIADLARVLRTGMKLYRESEQGEQHSRFSTILPGEVNGVEQNHLNPTVFWYQDEDRVIMTLDKIGRCSLITTADSVQFRLLDAGTDQQYGFDIELFDQMSSATYSQKGLQTKIQIHKAKSGTWCRLQKAARRPFFLHYDTSQLAVPMSDENDEPNLPFDYESDSSDLSSDCLEPSHYDEKQARYEE